MGRWVFVIAVAAQLLLAGCSTASDSSRERRQDGGPDDIESTSSREERVTLTGIITDVWRTETTLEGRTRQHRWITVEEHPGARDCQENPLSDGCEKVSFGLDDARVFLERDELEPEPVGVLERDQKVRADYTGQDVATTYPEQTNANTVVILEPR